MQKYLQECSAFLSHQSRLGSFSGLLLQQNAFHFLLRYMILSSSLSDFRASVLGGMAPPSFKRTRRENGKTASCDFSGILEAGKGARKLKVHKWNLGLDDSSVISSHDLRISYD